MKTMRWFLIAATAAAMGMAGCAEKNPGIRLTDAELTTAGPAAASATQERNMSDKIEKTDEEWRKALTPEEYRILRKKGTEPPFSGEYWDSKADGVYKCAACGQELFSSDTKFKSGTGWPSFWEPIAAENVAAEADNSLWMKRTEVLCSRCGGHLGHVFEDGPKPTGLRYCINSAALDLEERKPE